MAQVNVDLSEYDMLRDSKAKAENEVKELKAEIEEYKKNARVIITTKKCYRLIDTQKVARKVVDYYRRLSAHIEGAVFPYYLTPVYSSPEEQVKRNQERMFDALESAIKLAIKECDTPDCYRPIGSDILEHIDSTTIVKGFEDVRLQVENALKEELIHEYECKKAEADKAKDAYLEKYKEVSTIVEKDYEEKLNSEVLAIKEQYATIVEEHKALTTENRAYALDFEKKQGEIDDLNQQIEVLNIKLQRTDSYKASAESFEKETVSLEKKVHNLEKALEAEKSKNNNIPWYKRLF